MGFVFAWLHVEGDALEQTLAQKEWTPANLEAALRTRGLANDVVNDLLYYSGEEPEPSWNAALAALTQKQRFDLGKVFPSGDGVLRTLSKHLPGAAPLRTWGGVKRPAVTLPELWKSTDVVGFEVVASADEVRPVAAALAPFHDRAACRNFAAANEGGWPAWLSAKKKHLRAWVDDDYFWNVWEQTLAAIDAVAGSQGDYLGFETG